MSMAKETRLSPGAALAAKRKIEKRQCLECDKVFEGISTAKYCSESCKQKAKRKRAKARQNQSNENGT